MLARNLEGLHISVPSAADDGNCIKGPAGRPNGAVTKPIALDASTGEVLVRKSTGKTKVRKGQSTEEYERQRSHFFEVEKGPVWTPVGWMTKEDPLVKLDRDPEFDLTIKQTRQRLTSHCHLLYYRKNYQECSRVCEKLIQRYEALENKKKIQKEIDELSTILDRCHSAL